MKVGSAGLLRIGSLFSASYSFKKINPSWGRRRPATPRLVICGIWARREGSLLGLAGCRVGGAGPVGQAVAPPWLRTHVGVGWGFWESELQLTWSKCSQEGPDGTAVESREGFRGKTMAVVPHCMRSQLLAITVFLPAAFSNRCSQAFFGRRQDKGPSFHSILSGQ